VSDRLAAFAGVIEYFAQATGDVPTLGLWKGTFAENLLWYVEPERHLGPSRRTKRSDFRIPSWSWLCVATGLDFLSWVVHYSTDMVQYRPLWISNAIGTDPDWPEACYMQR
jgi:hypothetical protein